MGSYRLDGLDIFFLPTQTPDDLDSRHQNISFAGHDILAMERDAPLAQREMVAWMRLTNQHGGIAPQPNRVA